MDTYLKHLLAFLLAFSLLAVTLIGGLELIIFSDTFFEWHYTNREIDKTTGMTVPDLMEVTDKLLAYIRDDRADLNMTAPINSVEEEVFGQREKDHMVDVKDLYLDARSLRRTSMVVLLAILIFAWYRDKRFLGKVLGLGVNYSLGLLLALGVIGGLFASDFNRYFTIFHHIFFDNDLWILNPATDIMINMVPESYFYSIVMIGLGLFVAMTVVGLGLMVWGSKRLQRR